VPKEVPLGLQCKHSLLESSASHHLGIAISGISGVEDAKWWAVCHKHIDAIGNLLPLSVDCLTLGHPGPVTVSRRPRRSPNGPLTNRDFRIDERDNSHCDDIDLSNESSFKGSVVIAGHKDLVLHRQR